MIFGHRFFLVLASLTFDCDEPKAQAVPKLKNVFSLGKNNILKRRVAFFKQSRVLEVTKRQHDAKTQLLCSDASPAIARFKKQTDRTAATTVSRTR